MSPSQLHSDNKEKMITLTNEEILFQIKKVVDEWDKKWFEDTGGNPVLEERRMWMWEECVNDIRNFLKEVE